MISNKDIPAQIYNLKLWIYSCDPLKLKQKFEELLAEANFNVLKFQEQHFPNEGYTAFWLLAESHLAIHTFPQEYCSYIELSSCNKQKALIFRDLLSKNKELISGTQLNIEELIPNKNIIES